MPALTDQQQQFVDKLVTSGCTPTEAARAAGYAVPHVEASRLIRKSHVQDAIREQRLRLINCDLANVALRTVREVMEDRQAPASARVSAARTAFEVAGMFDRNGRDIETGKQMQEMTVDELSDTIHRLDREMERASGSAAMN